MIRLTLRRVAAACTYGGLVALAAGVGGCNTTDTNQLPPNIVDPATLKTPAGAMGRYRAVRGLLPAGLNYVVQVGGIMTDELAALPAPFGSIVPFAAADSRTSFSGLSYGWPRLHKLRSQAREGRGFLTTYVPDSSTALQGLMFAYEAYADIYLADLFCSGIPLSTVNFDGSYTVAPGSTTDQVYQAAVALFDSALAISSDSVSIQQAAAVGKGRALLALGRYAEAAAAVGSVPDEFTHYARFSHQSAAGHDISQYVDSLGIWSFGADLYVRTRGIPAVADQEGLNGLDYRSSGDPRSSFTKMDGTDPVGNTMYFPAKYTQDIGFPGLPRFITEVDSFVVASGIEARLIEAEAALQANPGDGLWLEKLNHLRQTMWTTIVADTVSDPWVPGPLPDLTDPGTDAARVDLVFRERAMWLFMTGHRQGDLRRLIRQYHRLPNAVYPTGVYTGGGGISVYGDEVVIPVPEELEEQYNPNYTGCFSGDA